MKKIRGFLGYLWAISAFFIVLATFIGNDYLSRKLAAETGVTVSARYSGGEIIRVIDHGAYKTYIHRPVFDGLISETNNGFIQINWEPFAGLPSVLSETITFDGNGKDDCFITLDTKTGAASLRTYNTMVVSVDGIYKLKNGWAARILLRKKT
jgi:hypothetical protein